MTISPVGVNSILAEQYTPPIETTPPSLINEQNLQVPAKTDPEPAQPKKPDEDSPPLYIANTNGGKAAEHFNSMFGTVPSTVVKATRTDLCLKDSDVFIVDVGGEGEKREVSTGIVSGNVHALNLNWQEHISPGTFELSINPEGDTIVVNGEQHIPNLVRPSTYWNQNLDYPFANGTVDGLIMQGAPLTEKNLNEIDRVVSQNGWILLNVSQDYKKNVNNLAKRRGDKVYELGTPTANSFPTYLIGPASYEGKAPNIWNGPDGSRGVNSLNFDEFVTQYLSSMKKVSDHVDPHLVPGDEETTTDPDKKPDDHISGQQYAQKLKQIACKAINSMGHLDLFFLTFNPQKGFNNAYVKQRFLNMAHYREMSTPTDPINYDATLNTVAANFANGIKKDGNSFSIHSPFNHQAVKSAFHDLVMYQLIQQNTTEPDLQKAYNVVNRDFRNRLINALRNKSEKKAMLAAYDRYWEQGSGRPDAYEVANQAETTFKNDPYLYLRPNARGQAGFPWQLVLDDIKKEVKIQADYRSDLTSPILYYLDNNGKALAHKWWVTTAWVPEDDDNV